MRKHVAGVPDDPYGRSAVAMVGRGAMLETAGNYLVVVDHCRAAGTGSSPLCGPVRFEVAVADSGDGRFVPGLTVDLSAQRGGRTLAAARCAFRRHPDLHRYTANLDLPAGSYDVTLRIQAPGATRDERGAGPVTVGFLDLVIDP
jgi:hypothetical protein